LVHEFEFELEDVGDVGVDDVEENEDVLKMFSLASFSMLICFFFFLSLGGVLILDLEVYIERNE
jgi:hypothetical protein